MLSNRVGCYVQSTGEVRDERFFQGLCSSSFVNCSAGCRGRHGDVQPVANSPQPDKPGRSEPAGGTTSGGIVTNAHVVQGADQVEVTFSDQNMMRAKVVGIDLDADLAVIKVQWDASAYKPVPLADSDALQVGDRAIAIGNPFERAGTMTQGI